MILTRHLSYSSHPIGSPELLDTIVRPLPCEKITNDCSSPPSIVTSRRQLSAFVDPRLKLLHMNPGACGRIGWHIKRTAMRFSIERDKVGNVELIELGPRTGK
jgi:hypothetical protein